jgi:predicted homoserine dehydrogenase-like protein
VVYSYADGDQPGAMMRLIEWARGTGFEIVAAVNCKTFMNKWATPDDIKPWAERMKTSLAMVCSFTDGTKMNMENAVVSNATGFIPEKRGMHGVLTTRKDALKDFEQALKGRGVVDYTLGGDFGSGVFVIGRSEDYDFVGHYLDYLKMGPGPNFLFFRPYHLCHIETPLSVAEAMLYGEPTIAPRGAPVVDIVAIAKRDLKPGDILDGTGGYTCYGEIDVVENAKGLLCMGLAENVRVNTAIKADEPIPLDAVDLDPDNLVVRLREEQSSMVDK